MTAAQDDMIAKLQRSITELRRERDIFEVERDAALARQTALTQELAAQTAELLKRKTAFDERIEYQAATNDVLKAMSASPHDAQPVFDLIAVRARDLCEAYGVTVYEYDGTLIH